MRIKHFFQEYEMNLKKQPIDKGAPIGYLLSDANFFGLTILKQKYMNHYINSVNLINLSSIKGF